MELKEKSKIRQFFLRSVAHAF